jgi:menaquinone-specific isochorismate synthase
VTATPTSVSLVAEVREIEPVHDVLAHFAPDGFAWLHDGTAIVTAGVAARVAVDDVAAVLAAVPVGGAVGVPGTGPLAVGALPFDPARAATVELAVPARTLVATSGRTFVTRIAATTPGAPSSAPPTRFVVEATRSPDEWRAMVERALAHISTHDVEKVVLAREVLVEGDAPFDVGAIVRRLVGQQPGSFVYATDGFVGASPELLVRRTGGGVESRPMAGTAVADGDADTLRALAESVKDQREHRFVVDAIADALAPVCRTLEIGPVPDVAVFGHVAHLATRCRGRLREPAPTALDLARLLHPTPAVGGTPTARAVELVHELEGFDRGRYAGPVGWVDAGGDGEWAIALRGAELDGARARLVAGAGIVAGSDPDAEWAETQAKLEPMLRALVRP